MIERKIKETKPVLAICYDFDKTLSPKDMQAQGYIQKVGYDVGKFWEESNALAKDHGMDQNLAYMLKMLQSARGKFVFNRKALEEYGATVELFPGVQDWFERIRKYGEQKGVIVEHYIISSGLKEMIEGTSIAQQGAFEQIYASCFYYDEDGVALWPAQVVNYTNKTQFLFRIEKGVLDVNDMGVNDPFPPEKIRVPFRNMVYIGDSDTDVPCMRLVNSYGGHSIGVYDSMTKSKSKVYKMMRERRIKYYAPADYSEGKELDVLLKSIIDRTAANEELESKHYICKSETADFDKRHPTGQRRKLVAIQELNDSYNFARTHIVIKKLGEFSEWSVEEMDELCRIAFANGQVRYVLSDSDVTNFYRKMLEKAEIVTPSIKQMKERLHME